MRWSSKLVILTAGVFIAGCDLISQFGQDFQNPATVQVQGTFKDACIYLDARTERGLVGSWTDCVEPFAFRLNLADGSYTLDARAKHDGLAYKQGQTTALLRRGQTTQVGLSRRFVQVEATAAWLTTAPGVAEAWMLPGQLKGAPTFMDQPPAELAGRVLVAREVIVNNRGTLRVPTGLDVAIRLVQGQQSGISRLSRLEGDVRVVLP
jgi:hypothetical protein